MHRFQNHPLPSNLPVTCRIGVLCAYYHIGNAKRNMDTGRRVAQRGAFLLPFRIVNLPPWCLPGGRLRWWSPCCWRCRPAFSRRFCKMVPPRRLFLCALLYVIRTETLFLASSLAFQATVGHSLRFLASLGGYRWWRLPPAGWSRPGTRAPAAAAGPRLSAVRPGT